MRLRIAARHSDLARLQAYRVGDALKAASGGGHEIEYQFRASLGDINQNDPLWKMPEKGVFTEDFIRDLVQGEADLVVHSWKDLPTQPRTETEIVATLPRADMRDLLLFRRDHEERVRAMRSAKILTSSPRRAYNLAEFLKTHLPFDLHELAFEPVRGNIPTRLKKLLAQDVDGLIVAKAALDRLLEAPEAEFAEVQSVIRETLLKTRFMVLPLSVNPTAAAQGALAIEVAKARPDVKRAVLAINCAETFAAVEKERAILASHGGGCHQKIGVSVIRREFGGLQRDVRGEVIYTRGLTDQGQVLDRASLSIDSWGIDPSAVPPAKSAADIFPREGEDSQFFERENLDRATWAAAESVSGLWVARDTAWPEKFKAGESQTVWTAGLRTWQKLAKRGVWVNGSADGLGEDELMRLEVLLGENKSDWVKLTHEDSERVMSTLADKQNQFPMKTVATYRLKPRAQVPDLRGRTHFFWASASAFERAVALFPEIISAHHASGPGHTHAYLGKVLSSQAGATLSVFLNVEEWRRISCRP
jgi:hydroxymethylbilane synthase